MTTKDAHKYVPLVQAMVENRLEVRWRDDEWVPCENTVFSLPPEHYRIVGKPAAPEQKQYYMPPELLEALKEYVEIKMMQAVCGEEGLRIDRAWSAVLAANERKQA